MIPVTKPYLPSMEKYQDYISDIWERKWLTNNGPLLNEFELKLKKYLGVKHLAYLSNGTIALQLAIKALDLKGEIITTPFSYVATTSSIVWENCSPVFVDIDAASLNIDASKIEDLISENTSAILATHCFGNPCDIDAIKKIADKHKLKVIYDGAHCFGTKFKGKSVFEYGDISTVSFHATKLMHTIEGGAVFTNNPDLLKKLSYMRNFGHSGQGEFEGLGINGKNCEFHAAMGILVLQDIDKILSKRKLLSKNYDELLSELKFKKPVINKDAEFNYAYYPIILRNEDEAVKIKNMLDQEGIFPRRYFYPSLSKLKYVKQIPTPLSDKVSSSILCLPLYHALTRSEQELIARIIIRTQKYSL